MGMHVDHLHPRKAFHKKVMEQRGLTAEQQIALKDTSEQLPNLQLLAGLPNQEKSAKPLTDWLNEMDPGLRDSIMRDLDIAGLDTDIKSAGEFFEGRRFRLSKRLRDLLVSDEDEDEDDSASDIGLPTSY